MFRATAICSAFAACTLASTAPGPFTATPLGTLGGASAYVFGINIRGQAVGTSYTSGGQLHAFLYDGTMHDLGTLGGPYSSAVAINASGEVAGYSAAFVLVQGVQSVEDHAFLYNGGMHDLGTLGGYISSATGINNEGHVVGLASTSPGPGHAFLYDGSMHDLGGTVSNFSGAAAINDAGQVVGYIGPGYGSEVAFFSGGKVMDLGANGGVSAVASGMNDSGWVAGTVFETTDTYFAPFDRNTYYAFLYRGGAFFKLGTPGGRSNASAINNSGWVVGYSADAATALNLNSRATLYVDGAAYDLNTLLAPGALPSGVYLVNAAAINDRNQIAANGSDGQAYVLTPVTPGSHAYRRDR